MEENKPAVAEPCDHHWVSEHKPGHRLFWVKTCSVCHEVDWDQLDADILALMPKLDKPLEKIIWRNEYSTNPEADSLEPPPGFCGYKQNLWKVTGFAVIDRGRILMIYYVAIPAVRAT